MSANAVARAVPHTVRMTEDLASFRPRLEAGLAALDLDAALAGPLLDYLALLLLLPLSLHIALAAEALVASRRMLEYVLLIVPIA